MLDPTTLPKAETIDDDTRAKWLALGADAIAPLEGFIATYPGSDQDDHARGHAVELLVALGATSEIPWLLELLGKRDLTDALCDALDAALPKFGDAIVPALCREIGERGASMPPYEMGSLCLVLARAGVKSELVFTTLVGAVVSQPKVAPYVAEYGDPRGLPVLERLLRDFDADAANMSETSTIVELREAFEALGGVLDAELQERVRAWEVVSFGAALAWHRWYRAHQTLPDLGDPSTIEQLRALTPSFDESIVLSAIATVHPDPEEIDDYARGCEGIALSPPAEREAAIARMANPTLARLIVDYYAAVRARS